MAVMGAILLMARYKVIRPKFAENWEETYQVSGNPVAVEVQNDADADGSVLEEEEVVPVKKKRTPTPKPPVTKKAAPKKATAKVDKQAPARSKRAKKSTE
jgi:hypothetical protein